MLKNKRLQQCAGVLMVLGAMLEESAYAKANSQKVQATLENRATLSPSADPTATLNGWQGQATVRTLQSKTNTVQSNGLSALESLKQQTSQLSRSLRTAGGVAEGRFEAPGLFEFSTFVNQKSSSESKDASRSEEIDRLRTATIQSIEKILRQPANANQRVDLMLRLAELHSERHSDFLIREMNQYEAAHAKWERNHRSGAEPKFSQTQSLQAIQAATQILRNLVNQYPNHPRTPDALYQLGFLLTEMKSESAALYFQRLIERFPKSKFIPDAQLAMGEYWFSRNKFSDALGFYQKAISDRNHRAYPYAVYKLGWTFFNIRGNEEETTKNLQKSLVAFKLLVKYIEESGSEKKLSLLRKDSLRDMVLVYAELGDIEEAQKYFKSMNETSLYTSLLERLAWLHADAGRQREAIEIYNRLLREFPLNAKNPQFLVRLAGLHEKDQNRLMLVESLQQLSELLSPQSEWWKTQAKAQDRDSAKKLVVDETQVWSLRLHAEFQKTKNRTTAQQALTIYDLNLQHLGESAAAYLPLFNRSQLHTSLEDHEKAIQGYATAAWIDKKFSLRRPETKVALENAIAESDILIQRRGPLSAVKNSQIPQLEARLVKLIDFHAGLFPKDTERVGLLHRAALIHLNAGQVVPAHQRWTSLAREAPQSAHVSEGLRLLIKRSFDQNNWAKAATDSRAFLKISGITTATVATHLAKLLRVALFQQALQTEKSGRHSDAAQQFLSYQKEFPTDGDAGKALINAANNQFKGKLPEEALATLNKFVAAYPNSEYQLRALEMTAVTAEALGRFADAAQAYEQTAGKKTNKELAGQDLAYAARLRLAENNTQRAVGNAEAAIPHLKRPADVCETFKVMLDAQVQMRSSSALATAQTALQKCQNTSPEWGIYFGGVTARMSMAAGQSGEAVRVSAQTLARGKTLSSRLQSPYAFEGLRIAGGVQLSVLEGQSRALLSRRVSDSNAIQAEFGKIKTEAQQLAQQYMQLAQSGQTETSIGAIYRLAEIQEGLASILVQAPNPSGMSPAESETFRARIEKIAMPMQEEAAKLYTQAFEKASEGEIISSYTQMLKEKLATINPSEHRKVIEVMPKPLYFAHELPMSKEVKGEVEEE
ncbi:MAG: hypothetical protein RL189_452 [Pseudomonadota bacterium]